MYSQYDDNMFDASLYNEVFQLRQNLLCVMHAITENVLQAKFMKMILKE